MHIYIYIYTQVLAVLIFLDTVLLQFFIQFSLLSTPLHFPLSPFLPPYYCSSIILYYSVIEVLHGIVGE